MCGRTPTRSPVLDQTRLTFLVSAVSARLRRTDFPRRPRLEEIDDFEVAFVSFHLFRGNSAKFLARAGSPQDRGGQVVAEHRSDSPYEAN
jgi:hypothetical protein